MSEFKPVAWLLMDGTIISEYSYNLRKLKEDGDIPLFTQRTWVGLSREDCYQVRERESDAFMYGVAWAEAKLKEKNT